MDRQVWQTIGEAPIMPFEESGSVWASRWLFVRTSARPSLIPRGRYPLGGLKQYSSKFHARHAQNCDSLDFNGCRGAESLGR